MLQRKSRQFQNPLNLYHSTSSSLQTPIHVCYPSIANFTSLFFLFKSYRSLKALYRQDEALQGQPKSSSNTYHKHATWNCLHEKKYWAGFLATLSIIRTQHIALEWEFIQPIMNNISKSIFLLLKATAQKQGEFNSSLKKSLQEKAKIPLQVFYN